MQIMLILLVLPFSAKPHTLHTVFLKLLGQETKVLYFAIVNLLEVL